MKIKITYEEFYEAILLYVKAIEKLRISDSFDNDCEFWGPFFKFNEYLKGLMFKYNETYVGNLYITKTGYIVDREEVL